MPIPSRKSGLREVAANVFAYVHSGVVWDICNSGFIVGGEGVMVIAGEEHHVKPNDAAFITPGTHHRIINTGDKPFRIAWSYATIHVSRTLVD